MIRFSRATAAEALAAMAAEGHLLGYDSNEPGRYEVFVPAVAHPRGYRTRMVVVPGAKNALQVGRLARQAWNRVHRPRRGDTYGEWLTEREQAASMRAEEIERGEHEFADYISPDGRTTLRRKKLYAGDLTPVPDDPFEERRIRERLRAEAGVDPMPDPPKVDGRGFPVAPRA